MQSNPVGFWGCMILTTPILVVSAGILAYLTSYSTTVALVIAGCSWVTFDGWLIWLGMKPWGGR